MSVGKRILQLRQRSKKSQREVAKSTGLAVSYLSRLENDRITPTVRTLGKIAKAFEVSPAAFFESAPVLEAADRCPVSLSGQCILDQLHVARGKKPKERREAYSSQQLQVLRLCDFLLHTQDKHLVLVLNTMLKSLLALSEKKTRSRADI